MRYLVFCALLAVASTLTSAGAQPTADYIPFQVITSSGTMVRVDIGEDRERARSLRRATVVTPTGAVAATFVRTERECEALCGEDGEKECHFEAILRTTAPVKQPVVVLAGSHRVGEIGAMSVSAVRPIDNVDRWLEAEPIKNGEEVLRWARFPDGIFLELEKYGRDFYAPQIDLASCGVRTVTPFTIVSCPTAELLYEGSRGIVASFADYGVHTVKPLLRFRLNGREAVVLDLGLKAYVATALLTKGADGLWQVTIPELDYARLC